jgi:SAM-dependent methyltransferase
VLVQRALPAMPAVAALLEAGTDVADVGCGRGGALIALARAFPRSHFVGYDAFAPTVGAAAARAAAAGVGDRVRFVALDAARGLPELFDVVTSFDVVHDAVDPGGLLRAIRAALRPGGRYVCFEPRSAERIEERVGPRSTFLYGVSLLYCMTTSLAGGGVGLGALGLPESAVRALCADAGFSAVRRVDLLDARGEEDRFHALYEVTP